MMFEYIMSAVNRLHSLYFQRSHGESGLGVLTGVGLLLIIGLKMNIAVIPVNFLVNLRLTLKSE